MYIKMDCYIKLVIISVIVLFLICTSHTDIGRCGMSANETTLNPSKHNIMKRNVAQLAYEIVHYCGWVQGSELMDYGCYCGKGGHGEPMDNLDRCCKAHDDCYSKLEQKHYYVNWYNYQLKTKTIECDDAHETDDRKLCECDKILLECVLRSEYHSEHHNNCSADNSLYKM